MNSSNIKIFENHDANTSFKSDWFDISRARSAALEVGNIASADLNGTMSLEVANEETFLGNALPDSSKAFVKSAATGKSNIWDLGQYGYAKFRFVWVYTSGTGTLTGVLNSKG